MRTSQIGEFSRKNAESIRRKRTQESSAQRISTESPNVSVFYLEYFFKVFHDRYKLCTRTCTSYETILGLSWKRSYYSRLAEPKYEGTVSGSGEKKFFKNIFNSTKSVWIFFKIKRKISKTLIISSVHHHWVKIKNLRTVLAKQSAAGLLMRQWIILGCSTQILLRVRADPRASKF